MQLLRQALRLYRYLKMWPEKISAQVVFVLIGMNIAACSHIQKVHSTAPEPTGNFPLAREMAQFEFGCSNLRAEREAQQQEIQRLQKLLAEKEAYIRSQEVRQQDQQKALQETSNRAAHAQVRLRRLATRPTAASTIAEVEMGMENLKSSSFTGSEPILQTQAQRLLDAAAHAYAVDNYAAAMDYASQAREFINMMRNNSTRKASDPQQVTVLFQVPIPLRAIANSKLREKPGLKAPILGVLKKESAMTAEAYRGEWLQILTADGRSGWIFSTLVEAQVAKGIDMVVK
ncbi:SH3 domain-containing protein [Nitrosospira multiformis]|uniref:SH3 domain-containing protein n=1 Tax=Nitrosospira multiformis TaxID=1231 RepID=A0A1I0E592_9PROT|nr:SH3 domain-containing protein [Nitrosospira multiformis]SET39948.1 SH3 domain-containing protein [Nitrosospira multiformis]